MEPIRETRIVRERGSPEPIEAPLLTLFPPPPANYARFSVALRSKPNIEERSSENADDEHWTEAQPSNSCVRLKTYDSEVTRETRDIVNCRRQQVVGEERGWGIIMTSKLNECPNGKLNRCQARWV